MQRVMIIEGAISKNYGNTAADKLNKILDNSPDFKLTQVIPLLQSDLFCRLLCVFERKGKSGCTNMDCSAAEKSDDKEVC